MMLLLSICGRNWRVALLLVAVATLTPGRASAECGDYLNIPSPHANNPRAQTHGIQTQTQPIPERSAGPAPTDATPAKTPCRGPNCSRAPTRESLPLAPVIPSRAQVKEPVQHTAGQDLATVPAPPWEFDGTFLPPIHRATSIFHPPRLV